MPRVLCTLRNCSELVSGKTFSPVPGGMVSEDLTPAEAERFLRIPGYVVYTGDMPTPNASTVSPDPEPTASAGAPAPGPADEPERANGPMVDGEAESGAGKKKGKSGKA